MLELFSAAIQIAVGLMLASAGIGKALRWHEFKGMLSAYELVPSLLLTVAAAAIVALELLTGFALVAGWSAGVFAIAAAGMFVVFAAAMAINLMRGRRAIDCGCFRSTRQTLEWRLVARNLVCALAVLGSAGFTMASDDPQRWLQAVPAGAALFAIYFALNSVWALDASRITAFTRN
jgi:hypothetical protein